MEERRIIPRAESIDFFPGGVKITSPATVDLPRKGGGDRGTVKGWSSSSRRRMREFLIEHKPGEGLDVYGVTLTVPGPPITPQESAHLFDHFSKNFVTRNGCGMVWRLEAQKRGAVHWHGILSSRHRLPVPWLGACLPAAVALRLYWLQALRVLGKVEWKQEYKGGTVEGNSTRDEIPGAEIYAVDVQADGGRGAWMRYLQDHATKAKQEQIAEGFGRHWGVVGRKCFERSRPVESHQFTSRKTFTRFLRAYRRLTCPVMSHRWRREKSKFNSRPFAGRSLGWSSSRGSRGVSVWFSKPETVKRLVEWAERN